MSFVDDLKRSLGFEGSQNQQNNVRTNPNDLSYGARSSPQYNSGSNGVNQFYNYTNYNSYDDDFSITPEQSLYEIILIKPEDTDDMDYVFDQVCEENNPVIIDLSRLIKNNRGNFRIAGEMLKSLRKDYNAQAILLNKSSDKTLILITPEKVNVVKK